MSDIVLEGTVVPITTTAAVTLTCGVATREYTDQAFRDAELTEDLELNLNAWLSKAGLNYVTIIGQGSTPGATPGQRTRYLLIRRYAKYYLAAQVAITTALSFAKRISDGQNNLERFDTDTDELVARLLRKADEARDEIVEEAGFGRKPATILTGATPTYDPVTDTDAES